MSGKTQTLRPLHEQKGITANLELKRMKLAEHIEERWPKPSKEYNESTANPEPRRC